MDKKLIVTPENVEMVNGILKNFGYESDIRFTASGHQFGNVQQKGTHANLRYNESNGFYLSVSGKWLNTSEGIQEYLKELREADRLISMLEANIKDNK